MKALSPKALNGELRHLVNTWRAESAKLRAARNSNSRPEAFDEIEKCANEIEAIITKFKLCPKVKQTTKAA